MPSRLLSDLNARIAKCRDPLENTCLRAEKAALLARQGELDAARRELAQIHSRYDHRPNAVVSAWVSLAEGLVMFHSNFGPSTRDKVQRAFALSSAVGSQKIRLLSAAWLAHLTYLSQDFERMAAHLGLVLAEAPSDADSALARACLVAAQAFHWAGRFDLAQRWYRKAHHHITREGDQPMLSAFMHNMAWLHVAQARRMAVSEKVDLERVRETLRGAESTGHFDQSIGTASLLSLVPILRAHILTLLGRHEEALQLFDKYLSTALSEGLTRVQCGMLAEIAWCHVSLGDNVSAERSALEAQGLIPTCEQADERAAAHGRLAQVFASLGEMQLSVQHAADAAADWQTHTSRQLDLVALLGGKLEILGP